MSGTYNTELYMGEILGDVPCVIVYDYTPRQAGRYSGPPESCYPDEPAEVDITNVVFQGVVLSPERLSLVVGELNELEQLKIDIIEHEEELEAEGCEP